MSSPVKAPTPGLLFMPTGSLPGPWPYCYRYHLQDDFLQASIKHAGIMMPVLVTAGDHPVVIAGHKRLYAAKLLKLKTVPVFSVKAMDKRESFLLNLATNWKQDFSEIDRAQALGMAMRELRFSEADTIRVIMPILGLPGDKTLLGIYLKVDQCPVPVKDLVADGQMPLRGMTFLLRFSLADQTTFARKICGKAKLTSSQLLQAGEWLADLIKGSGKDLETILADHKVLEGLDVRGMDPRTKADKLFAAIKRLRFSGYSRYLEVFDERRAGVLQGVKDLRVEPVQGFEEPGFELRARVKSAGDLDRLLSLISEKRSALNSLFEIML